MQNIGRDSLGVENHRARERPCPLKIRESILRTQLQLIKKVHALVGNLKENSRTHRCKIALDLHQIALGGVLLIRRACDGKNASRSTGNVDRAVGAIEGACVLRLVHMGDDNDGAAGVLGNGNQVVELSSCFVGVVHRAVAADIRTHQVEDQQLGVVLLHGFTDTVVPEGQTLLFLSDKK